VQSVTAEDLPVIVGIVLLASFFVVVANIIVDLCYAVLDPRVRIS
jgi:peptide/nickel transport system permease protein